MPTLTSDVGAAEPPSVASSLLLSLLSLPHAPRARIPAARTAANFVVRRKTPPSGCRDARKGAGNQEQTLGPPRSSKPHFMKLLSSRCGGRDGFSSRTAAISSKNAVAGDRDLCQHPGADRHRPVVDAQVALVEVVRRTVRRAGAEPAHRPGDPVEV